MANIKTSMYNYRELARVILEATTPLSISSGEESIFTKSLVRTDFNDLPFIPGTSFTGVLRHLLAKKDKAEADAIFGSIETNKGSLFTCTDGKLMAQDGKRVLDGLQNPDFKDPYFKVFSNLPIRQHVRMTHRGAAAHRGKFDEQVAPKGSRFCIEMELLSDKENGHLEKLLDMLYTDDFTLGSGSRKGFGKLKVIDARYKKLDLNQKDDLECYLSKKSSLNDENNWWIRTENYEPKTKENNYDEYLLKLTGADFVHFGSGHGDNDVDDSPLEESFLKWTDQGAIPVKSNHIIPGSSLKGVLAHRTAYYFNKKQMEAGKPATIGQNNLAVVTLFGSEGQEENTEKKRGLVLFSDVIENLYTETKIFNHNSISQFTGGCLEGHLFDEKVVYCKGKEYNISILVPKVIKVPDEQKTDDILSSFEEAMKDLCRGQLPLGGFVNRGHGTFYGKLLKNGKELPL